jgi:exodeoxyribonuclease III
MKLATFNINNVNKRLSNLLVWLKAAKPDIVCLQELKAEQAAFPTDALESAGYRAAWVGQKTWNGVALLSRRHEIHVTRQRLPGDQTDRQSRYIEAAINGIVVGCIYLPNGNPQPGPKFDYKQAWFERLIRHARGLIKTGAPVALVGDFNVVPADFDIYPTKSWDNDALVHPESRAAFERLLKQGWTDAIRMMHPEDPMYTFWDYKRRRWDRDAGLRIDHFILSPQLLRRLKKSGVDRSVRGEDGASDHAPAWIELK